ncbi:hypothetical protein ACFPVT_09285 [Corynebacterium choanae]|nr:hypothetical protein [Corynebacterium choanae]
MRTTRHESVGGARRRGHASGLATVLHGLSLGSIGIAVVWALFTVDAEPWWQRATLIIGIAVAGFAVICWLLLRSRRDGEQYVVCGLQGWGRLPALTVAVALIVVGVMVGIAGFPGAAGLLLLVALAAWTGLGSAPARERMITWSDPTPLTNTDLAAILNPTSGTSHQQEAATSRVAMFGSFHDALAALPDTETAAGNEPRQQLEP